MAPRRFQFRLQTVLDYKERMEEEEQQKLARKKEKLASEENRLLWLKHLHESRRQEAGEKRMKGRLNVDELTMYHEYEKKLEKEVALQNIRVQQAQAAVETQRRKLLEATQEKKTYEKLKEKHFQGYLAEAAREESKILDELGTTKFARNLREP